MNSITDFLDPKSQPNAPGDETVDVDKELDKKESDLDDDSDTVEVNLSDKKSEEKPKVKSVTLPATKEVDSEEVATGEEAEAEDNAAESALDDIDKEEDEKTDDAAQAVDSKADDDAEVESEEAPKKEAPSLGVAKEEEAEEPADETDAENPEEPEAEESAEEASAEEENPEIDNGTENDLEADQEATPPLLKLVEEYEYHNTKVYETPNGAKLVYVNVPSELCYCMFQFKVGSFYEDDSNRGVSHLLEHLMFNGCPGMSSLEFNEKMDKLGVSVNAFTDRAVTAYHFNGLKSNFVTAFDLYANLIKSFTPTDEIVDKERGVVLNEIGVYEDDNWSCLHEAIHAQAYRQHPICHPILGYEDVIKNISTDQVREWYQSNYCANNLTLYLVGDFPEEDLIFAGGKLQLFESGEANIDPVITDAMALPLYKNVITRKEGVTQTLIDSALEFKKEAFNYYELDILAKILGGTMSSYLWEQFREERAIAYQVGAYESTLDIDHLMIHLYAGLNNQDDAVVAKDLFKDAFAYAKAIPEDEFLKGQNVALLSELKSDETMSGILGNVREAFYLGIDLDEYMTTLKNLTFDSYQAFTEQIDPEAMVTGILFPLSD